MSMSSPSITSTSLSRCWPRSWNPASRCTPVPHALANRAGQDPDAPTAHRVRVPGAGLGGPCTIGSSSPPSSTTTPGSAVVKTPRGGYDGKGVRVVARRGCRRRLVRGAGRARHRGPPCWPRSSSDSGVSWPSWSHGDHPVRCGPGRSSRTVQRDGVCAEVFAPAPAGGIAGSSPPVNSRSPSPRRSMSPGCWPSSCSRPMTTGCWSMNSRCAPHNTGHWTIDGALTSQFEQHLRAVLDLPLGLDRPDRAVVGDDQRARRPDRGDAGSISVRIRRSFPR